MNNPSNISNFILKLSKDAKLQQELRKDPKATMDAAGLSAADQNIIREGDPEKIRNALSGHPLVPHDTVVVVVVAVFI